MFSLTWTGNEIADFRLHSRSQAYCSTVTATVGRGGTVTGSVSLRQASTTCDVTVGPVTPYRVPTILCERNKSVWRRTPEKKKRNKCNKRESWRFVLRCFFICLRCVAISFAMCFLINVPGHNRTLHSLVSSEGPSEEQSTPPWVSLGKVHFRVLSCVPPPQVAEHGYQWDQSEYTPVTEAIQAQKLTQCYLYLLCYTTSQVTTVEALCYLPANVAGIGVVPTDEDS